MSDHIFMGLALDLAHTGTGTTSPNPSVGAIIVLQGVVVGEGATEPAGGRHAEIVAIAAARERARGATLYTTLEPCSHKEKRTPPCVDAIISAGIARVVVGMRDPNPAVDGRGIAAMRAAGIIVDEGVLLAECVRCHEFFSTWITKHRPFVTLKMAMTIDAIVTWGDGKRKQISSDSANTFVHELRSKHDAVLVGVETVLADDPRLTARIPRGRNPLRVVVDSSLRIPATAHVLSEEGKTIVCSTLDARARSDLSCETIRVESISGKVDLRAMLEQLAKRDVTSVLAEVGPSIAASLLEQGLVDKVIFIVAPFSVGSGRVWHEKLTKKIRLNDVHSELLGCDVVIEGTPEIQRD